MNNTAQNIQQDNTKYSNCYVSSYRQRKMHKEFRKQRKMPAKKCWQAI